MESLSKFWDERTEILMRPMAKENIEAYFDFARGDFPEKDPMRHWEALQHLPSRSWFERVWVRQELCLSRDVLVQCGRYRKPWTWFIYTRGFILQHMASIERMTKFEGFSAIEVVTSLHIKTQSRYNLQALSVEYRSTERPSLIYVLNNLRYTHATDPRDKVYAALGLARADERIPIDYSIPVEAVYMRTTKQSNHTIIQHSGLLQLPSQVEDPAILGCRLD